MNAKVFAAVLAGLVVVVMLVTGAVGPGEAPKGWEYKTDFFLGQQVDDSKKLNDLAAERWEYVGLVATPGGGAQAQTTGWVAFKRPKK